WNNFLFRTRKYSWLTTGARWPRFWASSRPSAPVGSATRRVVACWRSTRTNTEGATPRRCSPVCVRSVGVAEQLDIVILGLSITSSWGNGHVVTYRGLVRALVQAGHRVTFAERDVPWYAAHRDLSAPPYGELVLYRDLDDLRRRLAP